MSEWLDGAGQPDGVGDPGRVHEEGRLARDAIERARASVAAFVGTEASRVVFTSGATEAANTAVAAVARSRPGTPFVTAAVEHSCVRGACARAGTVLELDVDRLGRVDLSHLSSLLAAERTALVSCQLANHEVGTLQPVAEVAAMCREASVPLLVDAAAGVGHVGVGFDELGADYMTLSAHKFGGPPGIGALLVRRGVRMTPLLLGGSEERGRRAGAENVIGIVGFGAACEALSPAGALALEAAAAGALTSALLAAATAVEGVEGVGDVTRRVPHIIAVEVGGVLGEAVLLSLDRAGVAAHSGSACSSEVLEPSPVLAAMGADPERSLRLSVGWSSTDDDVTAFGAAFGPAVERLRALGSDPTRR